MTGTFDNRKARFGGGAHTSSKKLSHIKRAAAARVVLDGYPIETPFETKEEVDRYLHADKITCLRCGKPYKSLALHLKMIHGWTTEQYREFYGLPWRTGLTAQTTKDKQHDHGRSLIERGVAFGGEVGTRQDIAARAPKRKKPAYQMRELKDRAWRAPDFYRVLDIMKENDATLKEVCDNEPDAPCFTSVRKFARETPEFRRELDAVHEQLSFPAQARAQRLGARFISAARVLRLKGMSYSKIADELGVTAMAVHKHLTHQ